MRHPPKNISEALRLLSRSEMKGGTTKCDKNTGRGSQGPR